MAMNETDCELLSQYLDGELASPDAQALRRRLLAEPELRAALEHMRKVNDQVRTTFDTPGADRVPPAIAARLQSERAAPSGSAVPLRGGSIALAPAPWKLAIAASLVAAAGVLLVPEWRQAGEQAGMDANFLAQSLESTPSGGQGWETLEDGSRMRAILSFANRDGSWCREYLLSSDGATYRGVACRKQGEWNTVVLAAVDLDGSGAEYRPASAGDSEDVAAYIEAHASDIPLSQGQERDLIANHWQ